jgi:hypothetical protein
MFERLIESDKQSEKEISPKFKAVYIAAILLSGFGLIFLFTVMKPLVYILYGYDPRIIGTDSIEDFRAFRETFPARVISFYIVAGANILCFILSFVALFRRTYLKSYLLTLTVFIFSALLSLFYWFVWIMSRISGAGMLG